MSIKEEANSFFFFCLGAFEGHESRKIQET